MLKNIEKMTGVTPPALKNRPPIGEAEYFFISCFYELNAFRANSEHPQPLTISDIKAYMDILGGFTVSESLRFLSVIRTLDQTFLKHSAEKS